jgi:hypothetical protein
MPKVICIDEERIRRAIREAEEDLYELRTLISYGEYERVGEAMEIEGMIITLENKLVELIEKDLEEAYPVGTDAEED